jgi:23S rRNA (cytosine1962-C5)-methyltransferase
MDTIPIWTPNDWREYELIDSGEGEKLERFGTYIIARPDPRALWKKSANAAIWQSAHARYVRSNKESGDWDISKEPPNPWHIAYDTVVFTLKPTSYKHVGIFPEQAVNWRWMKEKITGKNVKVLNLFAYTGGATLAAAAAGAEVTHVDSAKSAITWARENAVASGLENAPIRWIEEDAYKFVQREARRGNTYDAIIMDPPRFGRGSQGEVWKLEENLTKLLDACKPLLSPKPLFVLINAYTADISSVVLARLMSDLMDKRGIVTVGELGLIETASGNTLPNGICARWQQG